jgi:ABC-2 type transport system permease protein
MVALLAGMAFTTSFLTYAKISQDPAMYAYSTVPDMEEALLSPFLVFCGLLIMFLSPLLTMRLLAEERHRGTIELLFTHPLRDREIIFGKYLAALGMVGAMMAVIGVDLILLAQFVDVEPVVLLFGLLTVFLMSAAFLSLGLFVSSVTRNQITAGTITFGLSMSMYIIGVLGDDLPEAMTLPETWPTVLQDGVGFAYGIFRALVVELAFDTHAREMAQGILQPRDVAYYLLFSAFFLFLTFRALESRRWRG